MERKSNLIASALHTMRPRQWIKNMFVFLPVFFNGSLPEPLFIWRCLLGFVAFSLTASAIYCLNDILDIDENRRHPVKKNRPLASGRFRVRDAWILFALLSVAGLSVSAAVTPLFYQGICIVGAYYLLNIFYCFGLKRMAVVDVFCIALGFVLRIVLGGVACSIWISPWIICMTFVLTLFMAFAKRRDDVYIRELSGESMRGNTDGYNMRFMDQILGVLAAVTIVCYITYTLQPQVMERLGSEYVYVTSIFVLAGILRYLQISVVAQQSGSPTSIVYGDRFIQCCILGWLITFMVIIYL